MKILEKSVNTALLSLMLAGVTTSAGERPMSIDTDSTKTIFDFESKTDSDQWVAVNDNVMGGISEGEASLSQDSTLVFSGSLSLANNGGFSSIRSLLKEFDLAGYHGVRIRVKGDGRDYQFRLRANRNLDGVAFKQDFPTTADTWTEIDLPFASFLPSFRGRILRDVPPVDPNEIRQMGFLIADKKAGPFRLMVDRITAYR